MRSTSVERMKQVETDAIAQGWSSDRMMDMAGRAIAGQAEKIMGHSPSEWLIIGLVGKGNNGGDTLIALAELGTAGYTTAAFIPEGNQQNDALIAKAKTRRGSIVKGNMVPLLQLVADRHPRRLLLIDGLIGTGFHGSLSPGLRAILTDLQALIHRYQGSVLAVDCPSGIDCRTGEADPAVLKADVTICLGAVKEGLLRFPAAGYIGTLVVGEIGLDNALTGWDLEMDRLVTEAEVSQLLPNRSADSHKGTFGTAFIMGGSENYPGAIVLCGLSALRTGVGLVTAGVIRCVYEVVAGVYPELTWRVLTGTGVTLEPVSAQAAMEMIPKVKAVAIGPGMGITVQTRGFLHSFLQAYQAQYQTNNGTLRMAPSLVVDADALKALAQIDRWWEYLGENVVLTPHPVEMSILTGLSLEKVLASRRELAREYSQKWGKVVLLKGPFTVIATPGGKIWILPIATSALAHAGSGDVLTGLITGYLAQGFEPVQAAILAGYIHGRAAILATGKLGSTAAVQPLDMIREIGPVLGSIQKNTPEGVFA